MIILYSLNCEEPLHNRQRKKDDGEPNRKLEEHFFCPTALYGDRTGTTECLRKAGCPVLNEDAQNKQNCSDALDEEDGIHDRYTVSGIRY
jgi:hypothetical protein